MEKTELASQYKLTAAGKLKKMKMVRAGPTYTMFRAICSWVERGALGSARFGMASLLWKNCASAARTTMRILREPRLIKPKNVALNVSGKWTKEYRAGAKVSGERLFRKM